MGKKRVDLTYPIWGKEVAVVSLFSDNIQYKFTESWMIELELGNKQMTAETYTRRELIVIVEGRIELTQFDKHPPINRTNKLAGIIKMAFSLDELENTDNLEDRSLSNVLLRYHVTGSDEFTCFELVAPQYK